MTLLTITGRAADAIRKLAADHHAGGLRISSPPRPDQEGPVELAVSLVTDSEPGDHVVGGDGCQVFIQNRLASLLADKALDTTGPGDREPVEFKITKVRN
jgi:Fe-S cluster assembly iron-binding protein IscA